MPSRSDRTLFVPALSWKRCMLLAALLPLATACMDGNGPTSAALGRPGSVPPQSPQPPAPLPPPPTISGPAALYQRVTPSSYGSDAYLLSLGADSAFVIEFPDGSSSWGWAGRYERTDSTIVFHYNAWSAAGGLEGRGTLRGDTLFIKYNVIMQMTDFEDGAYVRSR
jgi:hypothetical protein